MCMYVYNYHNIATCVCMSITIITLHSTGDVDYVHIQNLTLFEAPTTKLFRRECINISIYNDSILEDTETFQIVLTSSDAAVRVVQSSSIVYILDDDSVRVSLPRRRINVSESDGLVSSAACVLLDGLIQQDIEVTLETQPRSAESEWIFLFKNNKIIQLFFSVFIYRWYWLYTCIYNFDVCSNSRLKTAAVHQCVCNRWWNFWKWWGVCGFVEKTACSCQPPHIRDGGPDQGWWQCDPFSIEHWGDSGGGRGRSECVCETIRIYGKECIIPARSTIYWRWAMTTHHTASVQFDDRCRPSK